MKRCALCGGKIEEEFGKLKGTVLNVVENNINKLIYVCSECQKKEGWVETAKIKSA